MAIAARLAHHHPPTIDQVRAVLRQPMTAEMIAVALDCRYDEVLVILHGWDEFTVEVRDWERVWRRRRIPSDQPAATAGSALLALAIIGVCGAITLYLLTDLAHAVR